MRMASTEELVLAFIKKKILRAEGGELTARSPLQGVLNSNALLALLDFIERDLNTAIPLDEFINANFTNVTSVVEFIERHRSS